MHPGQLPARSSQHHRRSQQRRERQTHHERDREANQSDANRIPKMQKAGRETGPVYRREENWRPQPHGQVRRVSAALPLHDCRSAARRKFCAAPP